MKTKAETKEKPIIIPPGMIPALLDGRKTQHRMPIKPPKPHPYYQRWTLEDLDKKPLKCVSECGSVFDNGIAYVKAPYQPGDRLWVRETWAKKTEYLINTRTKELCALPAIGYRADYDDSVTDIKWKSPIRMERWASRITLEVVGVKVQRFDNITEEDAIAEGFNWLDPDYKSNFSLNGESDSLIKKFAYRWDSLHVKKGYGWDANPFVWVFEFKVEVKA